MALPAVLVKAKNALKKAGQAKEAKDIITNKEDNTTVLATAGIVGCGCAPLGCLIFFLMLFIIGFSNIFGAIQYAVGDIVNGISNAFDGSASVQASSYLEWAEKIANDNTHGYSQCNRNGPDYDCSSFVWHALVEGGGFTKDQLGGSAFSTSDMPSTLKKAGFTEHTFTKIKDLQPGDILLRDGHTEIYYGDGKTVGAHSSETWGKCGKTGDQGHYDSNGDKTGEEIDISTASTSWSTYYRWEK